MRLRAVADPMEPWMVGRDLPIGAQDEEAAYEVGESPLREAYAALPRAADDWAVSISRKETSICRRSSQRTLRTQRRLCNSVSRPTAANRG